jgi:hypothetical protein
VVGKMTDAVCQKEIGAKRSYAQAALRRNDKLVELSSCNQFF